MVVKSRESERKEIILEKKSNATELMRRISMEKKKKDWNSDTVSISSSGP